MGYAVYEIGGRFCGYGVPSICDHSKCNKEIDRGLAFICGSDVRPEHGCGQYFCAEHLFLGKHGVQLCHRCFHSKPPFKKKPDTKEWTSHILTDDSWKEWRETNKERCKAITPLPNKYPSSK